MKLKHIIFETWEAEGSIEDQFCGQDIPGLPLCSVIKLKQFIHSCKFIVKI